MYLLIFLQVRKIRGKKALKADDLVPLNDDYLRDLGSRRRRRGEEREPVDEDRMETNDIECECRKKYPRNFRLIGVVEI